MRCYACDCELSDSESTRKSPTTNEYLDLCNTCYGEVQDIFIEVAEEKERKEEECLSQPPLFSV